jgi:hypothetical protein
MARARANGQNQVNVLDIAGRSQQSVAMTATGTLLLAILAVGALIGWSLQRAHGAWSDYQDIRARVPRARNRFRSHVGSAVRWSLLIIVVVFALFHL